MKNRKKTLLILSVIIITYIVYRLFSTAYDISKVDKRILEVTEKSSSVMKGSCYGGGGGASVALYLFDKNEENYAIIYIPESDEYKSYYITKDWQNLIEENHHLNDDTKLYLLKFMDNIKAYHYDAQFNLSQDPFYTLKSYYWEYIEHRL
jgi:hypothetical protein